MFCTVCGAALVPGAPFCPRCGARVAPAPPETANTAPEAPACDGSASPSPGDQAQTPPPVYGGGPAPYGPGQHQTPPPVYGGGPAPYGPGQPQTPPPVYGGGPAPYGPGQPQTPPPAWDPTLSPYYAREFAAIAQGGKSRFNWAAFFLGGYQALYRGHTRRFVTFYLPLVLVGLAIQLANLAAVLTHNYSMVSVVGLLTLPLGIVGLVVGVINGLTFNRSYCNARGGDAHVPRHGGRVAALVAVYLVIAVLSVVGSVLSAVDILSTTPPPSYSYSAPLPDSDVPLPGADEVIPLPDVQPAPDSDPAPPATYDGLEGILNAYGAVGSDQLYYFGYCDPFAEEEEALLESAMLFCSDDVTLLDALTEGSEALFWGTYEPEEGAYAPGSTCYLLYCTLPEGEAAFDVVLEGGNTVVFGGYWMVDGEYQALDDADTCALLACLYNRAGASVDSLAARVRGNWRSNDGEMLMLDANTLNGEPYTLWYISRGVLAVYLDGVADESGDYYMTFADDLLLNVWQYNAEGNVINDQYYARVG